MGNTTSSPAAAAAAAAASSSPPHTPRGDSFLAPSAPILGTPNTSSSARRRRTTDDHDAASTARTLLPPVPVPPPPPAAASRTAVQSDPSLLKMERRITKRLTEIESRLSVFKRGRDMTPHDLGWYVADIRTTRSYWEATWREIRMEEEAKIARENQSATGNIHAPASTSSSADQDHVHAVVGDPDDVLRLLNAYPVLARIVTQVKHPHPFIETLSFFEELLQQPQCLRRHGDRVGNIQDQLGNAGIVEFLTKHLAGKGYFDGVDVKRLSAANLYLLMREHKANQDRFVQAGGARWCVTQLYLCDAIEHEMVTLPREAERQGANGTDADEVKERIALVHAAERHFHNSKYIRKLMSKRPSSWTESRQGDPRQRKDDRGLDPQALAVQEDVRPPWRQELSMKVLSGGAKTPKATQQMLQGFALQSPVPAEPDWETETAVVLLRVAVDGNREAARFVREDQGVPVLACLTRPCNPGHRGLALASYQTLGNLVRSDAESYAWVPDSSIQRLLQWWEDLYRGHINPANPPELYDSEVADIMNTLAGIFSCPVEHKQKKRVRLRFAQDGGFATYARYMDQLREYLYCNPQACDRSWDTLEAGPNLLVSFFNQHDNIDFYHHLANSGLQVALERAMGELDDKRYPEYTRKCSLLYPDYFPRPLSPSQMIPPSPSSSAGASPPGPRHPLAISHSLSDQQQQQQQQSLRAARAPPSLSNRDAYSSFSDSRLRHVIGPSMAESAESEDFATQRGDDELATVLPASPADVAASGGIAPFALTNSANEEIDRRVAEQQARWREDLASRLQHDGGSAAAPAPVFTEPSTFLSSVTPGAPMAAASKPESVAAAAKALAETPAAALDNEIEERRRAAEERLALKKARAKGAQAASTVSAVAAQGKEAAPMPSLLSAPVEAVSAERDEFLAAERAAAEAAVATGTSGVTDPTAALLQQQREKLRRRQEEAARRRNAAASRVPPALDDMREDMEQAFTDDSVSPANYDPGAGLFTTALQEQRQKKLAQITAPPPTTTHATQQQLQQQLVDDVEASVRPLSREGSLRSPPSRSPSNNSMQILMPGVPVPGVRRSPSNSGITASSSPPPLPLPPV